MAGIYDRAWSSGGRGRRFKSSHSDQESQTLSDYGLTDFAIERICNAESPAPNADRLSPRAAVIAIASVSVALWGVFFGLVLP